MSWLFFGPLVLVVLTTLAVTPLAWRLQPRVGTWCLTGLAVATTVATAGSALSVVAGGLPGAGALAQRYGWCRNLTGHGSSGLAVAAAVLGAAAVGNVVRVLHGERRQLAALGGGAPVRVLDVPGLGAYAVPGRPGSVVVTTGLLTILSADERRAMFAHERAHLDLHHHRHVRAVRLAAAALPVLRPLVPRVRFTTERWADEHAAAEVGDRSSVARALVAAALGGTEVPGAALAAATLGVAARVAALGTQPRRPAWQPVAAGVVVAAVAGAATQSHHLVTMLVHLCG